MCEQPKTLTVHTDPSYPVCIGAGLLEACGDRLRALLPVCHLAVVTDSTVAALYLDRAVNSLRKAGFAVSTHIFPAGEENKNFSTLSDLLESFAAAQLTRSDCVVALGGGVTGDMAGFAASVYLRGIPFVQLPTTLLAAVDASVGGKTAVDLRAGKNLAGVFHQPAAVLCDTDCLKTLPPDTLADGVAEAVKTGVLSDETLFSLFEDDTLERDPAEVILRCVAYKAGVVERDEQEQGERKLLNLGHTVGHAVEKCSGFTVSHGHAVAIGMAVMARAAVRLGWAEADVADRLCRCLTANALPIHTAFSAAELAEAALSDKKRSGDVITVVVPVRIGSCTLRKLPVTELTGLIAAGLEA